MIRAPARARAAVPAATARRAMASAAKGKRQPRQERQPAVQRGVEEVMAEVVEGNAKPFVGMRNAMSAGVTGDRSAVAHWPVEEVEKLRRGQKTSGEARAENESMVRGPLFEFADETFAREDIIKQARAPPAPASVEERLTLEPELYAASSKPSEHTRDMRGRYFEADPEVLARVPDGVASRRMRDEFSATGGALLMIREPAWTVKEALVSGTGPRTVTLHGRRGTGKSAALHYVAQAAAEKGWLILHAHADQLVDDRLGMIRERADGSGVFEQPRMAEHLIARLLESQRDTLVQMKARNGQSLAELLEGGALEGELDAADVFARFLAEVRACKDVPTLVMVDNVNAWDTFSSFHDPATRNGRLHATRLGLVQAFSAFHSEAPAAGMSVFATSGNFSQKRVKDHYAKQSERSFNVRPYSLDEVVSSLAHYQTSNLMHFPVDEASVSKVQAISGGNPADVYEAAVLM